MELWKSSSLRLVSEIEFRAMLVLWNTWTYSVNCRCLNWRVLWDWILYHCSLAIQALDYCQRRGGVCMTTYGLVQTQWEQLGQTKFRREFVWDYIILDEGHKIKNPTKTTKGLHSIPSRNRLILTGKGCWISSALLASRYMQSYGVLCSLSVNKDAGLYYLKLENSDRFDSSRTMWVYKFVIVSQVLRYRTTWGNCGRCLTG